MSIDPDDERSRLASRLAILEGVIRAHGFGPQLIADLDDSADRRAAVQRLAEPPYGFDEVVANNVLDAPLYARTRLVMASVREEVKLIREQLAT